MIQQFQHEQQVVVLGLHNKRGEQVQRVLFKTHEIEMDHHDRHDHHDHIVEMVF